MWDASQHASDDGSHYLHHVCMLQQQKKNENNNNICFIYFSFDRQRQTSSSKVVNGGKNDPGLCEKEMVSFLFLFLFYYFIIILAQRWALLLFCPNCVVSICSEEEEENRGDTHCLVNQSKASLSQKTKEYTVVVLE